ncbi:Protein CASP [Platanthera guangdongensis]|uniref:Protein CASP n=1 Tax=Platanthera guangdongensis TaxID=2320717 RepID=A0ABR2LL48_9ASPA
MISYRTKQHNDGYISPTMLQAINFVFHTVHNRDVRLSQEILLLKSHDGTMLPYECGIITSLRHCKVVRDHDVTWGGGGKVPQLSPTFPKENNGALPSRREVLPLSPLACTVLSSKGASLCEDEAPFLITRITVSSGDVGFNLEKERSGLDEEGLKIAENQEVSQKNRRKLAENTRGMLITLNNSYLSMFSNICHEKLCTFSFPINVPLSCITSADFKKASSGEKLNLFNSLLKGYQEEVDNLTKRAKFGENTFLNIYQKLYEAPDPYPALASIAEQEQRQSELESENRKMKLELEEFRTEATHLKNQQATIRRLEERNRQLEQQRHLLESKQYHNFNFDRRQRLLPPSIVEIKPHAFYLLRSIVPCLHLRFIMFVPALLLAPHTAC